MDITVIVEIFPNNTPLTRIRWIELNIHYIKTIDQGIVNTLTEEFEGLTINNKIFLLSTRILKTGIKGTKMLKESCYVQV